VIAVAHRLSTLNAFDRIVVLDAGQIVEQGSPAELLRRDGIFKRMHAGRSAQSGLYGALLAERGFTGITDVFESPYGGFCTTFSRSQDRFNRAELTAGLGERFETMRISLKFYSCVGTNHTTLDAIRLMQAHHLFGPDDVERIIVRCSQATLEHAGWAYRPDGMTSAQLNLSYCVAVLLLEGDVFVDQFSEAALADPRRLALAAKVEAREDPAITARGSKSRHTVHVTVRLNDGTTLEETVETPRGSERHFPERSAVTAKFAKLASRILPRPQVEHLAETVLKLDKLPDVRALLQILAQTAPR